MTTVGEILPRFLEAYGISHVFGIPGIHNVELYRGLPDTRLRHVTPRHEQGAGFMADGFARASGKPAACFTITGPGLTNILTPMGQAYSDSIPMLVISSVNARTEMGSGRGHLHELRSQNNLAAGVSAFTTTVLDPGQLEEAIARAFAVFDSARPRPVNIEIPTDVLEARFDADIPAVSNTPPPGPEPDTVARANALLAEAVRPVCVFGGGAKHAAKQAATLAETLGAPTVLTVNARGMLPPNHPLLAGANLASPAIRALLEEADVVLAVGTEFGETEMAPLPLPVNIRGTLIRVDIDAEQLVRRPRADIAIVSDSLLALNALLDGVVRPAKSINGRERAHLTRVRYAADLDPSYDVHRHLIDQIGQALPDFRLVGDSTKPVYAATEFLHMLGTRRFFSASTGYGTLGFAVPAAIGACLAEPNVPAVALAGDGGVMFTLSELAVAEQENLPIAVVVWNNNGYAEIRDAMRAKDVRSCGVDHTAPDFVSLAKALGCRAQRAEQIDDVGGILSSLGRDKSPLVLVVDEPERN